MMKLPNLLPLLPPSKRLQAIVTRYRHHVRETKGLCDEPCCTAMHEQFTYEESLADDSDLDDATMRTVEEYKRLFIPVIKRGRGRPRKARA